MVNKLRSLPLLVCLPACLLADFSYEQTTRMTGGAMMGMMKIAGAFSKQANEPVRTTVSVKGNRMFQGGKDHAQIIDLDSETITDINFAKKQYSVTTFAEMTRAMEQAMQRGKSKTSDASPSAGKPNDTTAEFKVDIKETGQTKQIAGYETRQTIMTMQMDATDQKTGNKGGMVMTSDMWIAPKIAGYDEIREFHRKMAAKMTWTPGGSALAAGIGAEMARGMAGISKEVAKLDGVALLMIVKMTPTGQPVSNISASGTQPPPRETKARPESSASSSASISGALGAKLGGLGGFGRKRKTEAPKEAPIEERQESASTSTPAPSGDASGALMEMTTETGGLSSAPVDESKFRVLPDSTKSIAPCSGCNGSGRGGRIGEQEI